MMRLVFYSFWEGWMMEFSVPVLSIVFMSVTLCISVILPILLLIILWRKTRQSLLPALYGAIVFVLFAMILEGTLHIVFLKNLSSTRNFFLASPLAHVAYACLMAGIFEETGRFAAFHLLKKKHNSLPVALSFGLGHGGVEALLLVGPTMINNLLISVTLNAGGAEALINSVPKESQADLIKQLTVLSSTEPSIYLAGGVERLAAMGLHIALSVLIWMVVTKRISFAFYPAAILLHAISNIPAALYQYGTLTNVWLVELMVVLFSLIIIWLVVFLYQRQKAKIPVLNPIKGK